MPTPTHDTLAVIDRYLRAIEGGDEAALLELLDERVVLHEHPNALNPAGRTCDRAEMLAGLRRGKTVTRDERYVVTNAIVDGPRAAVELEWSTTLAVDVGARKAGDVMRGRFASFFELREGRVVRQAQYDCFLP